MKYLFNLILKQFEPCEYCGKACFGKCQKVTNKDFPD